jgi:hypothetical protein
MEIQRNQVWKFHGKLWRVEAVEGVSVSLVQLLGAGSLEALTFWLLLSPEWELVYSHG